MQFKFLQSQSSLHLLQLLVVVSVKKDNRLWSKNKVIKLQKASFWFYLVLTKPHDSFSIAAYLCWALLSYNRQTHWVSLALHLHVHNRSHRPTIKTAVKHWLYSADVPLPETVGALRGLVPCILAGEIGSERAQFSLWSPSSVWW